MSISAVTRDPQVASVEVSDSTLSVLLRDGRKISAPLSWFPTAAIRFPRGSRGVGAFCRGAWHSLAAPRRRFERGWPVARTTRRIMPKTPPPNEHQFARFMAPQGKQPPRRVAVIRGQDKSRFTDFYHLVLTLPWSAVHAGAGADIRQRERDFRACLCRPAAQHPECAVGEFLGCVYFQRPDHRLHQLFGDGAAYALCQRACHRRILCRLCLSGLDDVDHVRAVFAADGACRFSRMLRSSRRSTACRR